jgi:hypothetical protein
MSVTPGATMRRNASNAQSQIAAMGYLPSSSCTVSSSGLPPQNLVSACTKTSLSAVAREKSVMDERNFMSSG